MICSKLLCSFHGVLLVSCQSSLPPGSLRGDFSLGQKPASFAPPAPALDFFLPRDRRRKLTQSALAQRSATLRHFGPRRGSIVPVPVQEPRICRHSSAHFPPDVRPMMAHRSIPQPVILAVAVFSTGRAVLPNRVWHSASGPTVQKCAAVASPATAGTKSLPEYRVPDSAGSLPG